MNRDDLKVIANVRRKEAKTLLDNGSYDGAYYLSGYVVECGLKACIAKKTSIYDFPDKRTVNDSYRHDLTILLGVAGLKQDLDNAMQANPRLELNWAIVKDWKVESRYTKHSRREAEDLYSAITNRQDGVLRWVRQYW